MPLDRTDISVWSSSDRFISVFLSCDFKVYQNRSCELYITDILIQMLLYVLSPFMIRRACTSSHFYIVLIISLTHTSVAVQSFAAVETYLVHGHEQICEDELQKEGLNHREVSMHKYKSLYFTFAACFYSSICVLFSFRKLSL